MAGESPFRAPAEPSLLNRAVPVSQELPRYRAGGARRDAVAGVTVAALALPSAMAYAEAAALAATLALLVAACFFAARLLRLGWFANYFSRPVLIGYIHGVAGVLVIGQLGFFPSAPLLAIVLIGLDIVVLHALTVRWDEAQSGY